MRTAHETSAPATPSPRVQRLKRAAANARSDADAMLAGAVRPLPAAVGIVPGLLSRAGAAGVRVAAGVLKRHPVSAILIAGVLIGTVVYHRSSSARRS